jgi:hypothetical protein
MMASRIVSYFARNWGERKAAVGSGVASSGKRGTPGGGICRERERGAPISTGRRDAFNEFDFGDIIPGDAMLVPEQLRLTADRVRLGSLEYQKILVR